MVNAISSPCTSRRRRLRGLQCTTRSVHAQLCLTLCGPMDLARQAPLSMGFSRQAYWSRLPFPTLGDLPNPGIKPMSLVSPALAGAFFTTSTTHRTHVHFNSHTTPCPTWWFRLFCHLGAFLWPMAKAAQTDRRKGHIFGNKQGCLLTQLPLVVIL